MNNQYELYEYARTRVHQKKKLYYHSITLLIGSIFLYVLNKIFLIGEEFWPNWYRWVIVFWVFLWVFHVVNVYITHRFMGKEWERKQIEKLINKQELRIAKLEKEITHDSQLKAESEQSTEEFKKKDNPQHNLNEE